MVVEQGFTVAHCCAVAHRFMVDNTKGNTMGQNQNEVASSRAILTSVCVVIAAALFIVGVGAELTAAFTGAFIFAGLAGLLQVRRVF